MNEKHIIYHEHLIKQVDQQMGKLMDGMVDLEWEIGRMSSSGEETHNKMMRVLIKLGKLINEQNQYGSRVLSDLNDFLIDQALEDGGKK